jgi:hypothetical protein
MNVLLFSITDSGQQNRLLSKAMKEFLGWNSVNIVWKKTYLNYEPDLIVKQDFDKICDLVEIADLFIFSDIMIDYPGMNLPKYVNIYNSIISGQGTPMRRRLAAYREMQAEGWAIVPPISDPTIASKLCTAPFENWIVPVAEIEEIVKGIERNEEITICHAPTKLGHKGTAKFESVLREKFPDIAYKRITKLPWDKALQEKAKCHIVLNSLGDESYGVGNALEGLVLGQEVVSNISPWDYALHPDLPMISTWGNKNGIEKAIKEALAKATKPRMLNTKNGEVKTDINMSILEKKAWVKTRFSPENQIVKWNNYIKWVMER